MGDPFLFSILLAVIGVVGCSAQSTVDSESAPAWQIQLQSVSVLSAPDSAGYPLGGISGIDYHAETDSFFAISDDPAERGPARFYRIKLDKDRRVKELETHFLRDPQGRLFDKKQVDPESIRYHPNGYLFWSSELGVKGPRVYLTNLRTGETSEFNLPNHIYPAPGRDSGARPNKFIEGIALSSDAKSVIFALEAPLLQDGDLPSYRDGAMTRMLVFDVSTGKRVGEYFYPSDPIYRKPTVEPMLADNGVSEILLLDQNRLLVLERSGWHIGDMDFAFNNRIYVVELDTRASSSAMAAHRSPYQSSHQPPQTVLAKSLFLSLRDYLGDQQENIEGMTFGRSSDSGRSLYLVSDNNFHLRRQTQLLEFLVSPVPDNIVPVTEPQ